MAKKQANKPINAPKQAKTKPPKKEGNAYDKIFREVVEKIFRPLVEKRLGVNIVKATPLKEKMQTTIEVEMDFFYEILTDTGLNLKNLVKNKRVLKKYINQLMMLSRLRKIEDLTIKIAEEMPIHYDIETDALYKRGTQKGIEKGKELEALKKNYLPI